MSWNAGTAVDPVMQEMGNYCAAACAQMILASLGNRPSDPTAAQNRLFDSIVHWGGPWVIGNPTGLSMTINTFNTGGASDRLIMLTGGAGSPSLEYRTARFATPYEACATIVSALYDRGMSSAVMVLGSTHWIVVHGACGDGDLAGPFGIRSLFLCNPDNGYYGGVPGVTKPAEPGFLLEEITYRAFLSTYFNGSNDGHGSPSNFGYGDDRQFVIVTDSRAAPRAGLALPLPIPLAGPDAANDAIENAVRSWLGDDARVVRHRLVIHAVRRTDRRRDRYYLVPLALEDGTGEVLRFDERGRYLGRAFATAADARALIDINPIQRLIAVAGEKGWFTDEVNIGVEAIWDPAATASPYQPVFALTTRGDETYYVSLGGNVYRTLHDRLTGEVLAPGSASMPP